MENDYLVSIMKKYCLGEEIYIYSFDHSAIGRKDDTSGSFIDESGEVYSNMTKWECATSADSYAFSNATFVSSLPDMFGENLSEKQLLEWYELSCKKIIYMVGKTENGKLFVNALNLDRLKEDVINSMDPSRENDEGQADFTDVISDVVAGKYSLQELEELKGTFTESLNDIQSVIDAIELQIESNQTAEYESTDSPSSSSPIEDLFVRQMSQKRELNNEFERLGIIDIQSLYQTITKTLIAQEEAAYRMIVEISRMLRPGHKKTGILLTGSTGVGKTLLLDLLGEHLGIQFLSIVSTQLTIPGYTGEDIEEYLWELYVKSGKDLEKAEHAIVYFDEIDKKGFKNKSDPSGKGVLEVLLKFLDGTTYTIGPSAAAIKQGDSYSIKTDNMIVVVGGAFEDVYDVKKRRKAGFCVGGESFVDEVTTEDFVKKALMPLEFMGRVPIRIHMKDWTLDNMCRMVLESACSPLKLECENFQELGVLLTATDGYVNSISQKALVSGIGARALLGLVADTTWRPYADVISHFGEIEEVILNEETVTNPKLYQLVKKK